MVHDCAGWRMKTRRAALAVAVAALPFAYFDGSAVHAQSIMRSPNLNIQSRIPTINPTVTPRALNQPAAAVASEKPAAGEANRSAAQ